MSLRGPAAPRQWRPPVVVVAIEDEVAQSMVCVALEHVGLHALATAGLVEAADLTPLLPDSPAAMVVMGDPSGPDSPLAKVCEVFGRHGLKAAPTVMLHARQPRGSEPPHGAPPPDLAALIRATKAIVLEKPAEGQER